MTSISSIFHRECGTHTLQWTSDTALGGTGSEALNTILPKLFCTSLLVTHLQGHIIQQLQYKCNLAQRRSPYRTHTRECFTNFIAAANFPNHALRNVALARTGWNSLCYAGPACSGSSRKSDSRKNYSRKLRHPKT